MTRSSTSTTVETLLVLLLLIAGVSAQSLDTRIATYILTGIAGLYSLVTCFYFLLIICICCHRRRRSQRSAKERLKVAHAEELGKIFPSTPLWPVYEEKEFPDVQKDTLFANVHAVEFEEGETAIDDDVVVGITDVVIANRSAIDNNCSKSGHEPTVRSSKELNSETASSVSGNEAGAVQDKQTMQSWTWNGAFSKEQQGPLKGVSSATESKNGDLRKRKFDGTSLADGKNTTQGQSSTQSNKEDTLHTSSIQEPMTSPLPRSEKPTKIDRALTVSTLHAALDCVADKWYPIGIQLKVTNKTLSAIRAINRNNTDMCMLRVCEEWLSQQHKRDRVPEWTTVIKVLRNRVVSETELADSLHQKYCSDENSDEEDGPTSKSYTWIN